MKKFLGIDIGGTKSAVCLAEYDGSNVTFLDKEKFLMAGLDVNEAIEKLIALSKKMLSNNGLASSDVSAVGINCGGPLDADKGIVLAPPNLIGWINIPIVEIFQRELGIKSFLQNDANAGALAEYMFGNGRGCKNVIFLTFGTGMGAGLVLDGRLYSGTNTMAGEVGHLRLDRNGPVGFGKMGSFEGFCSGGGIAQLAKTMALGRLQVGEEVSFCSSVSELDKITAESVAVAANQGDPLAKEIYAVCGRYLGYGLSLLIDILNPQVIILGSIFSRSKHLLWDEAKKVIDEETIPFSRSVCKVVESGLGEQIGDYEAVSIAIANDSNFYKAGV